MDNFLLDKQALRQSRWITGSHAFFFFADRNGPRKICNHGRTGRPWSSFINLFIHPISEESDKKEFYFGGDRIWSCSCNEIFHRTFGSVFYCFNLYLELAQYMENFVRYGSRFCRYCMAPIRVSHVELPN